MVGRKCCLGWLHRNGIIHVVLRVSKWKVIAALEREKRGQWKMQEKWN